MSKIKRRTRQAFLVIYFLCPWIMFFSSVIVIAFFFFSALLTLSLWVEKVKGLWYFLSGDERNRTLQGHAIKVVRTARCCSFFKMKVLCMVCIGLMWVILEDACYTRSDIDLACLLFNLSITLTSLPIPPPAFVAEYASEAGNPMRRSQAVHIGRDSGKRRCLNIYYQ